MRPNQLVSFSEYEPMFAGHVAHWLIDHMCLNQRAFSLQAALAAQEISALNQAFEDREGCRVSGWLDVQRVAGNFHVAVHMEDYVMLDRVRTCLLPALSKHTPMAATAIGTVLCWSGCSSKQLRVSEAAHLAGNLL